MTSAALFYLLSATLAVSALFLLVELVGRIGVEGQPRLEDVDVAADGRLSFAPPRSRPGDAFVVRAEMDLAVALSACPCSNCNGGAPARPVAFEVLPG